MFKTSKIISAVCAAVLSASVLASCGSNDTTIAVISREDGSGTRGAFIELTGVEEKDADGNKTDKTTKDAMICKSTDVVLTQVAGDANSIGYISLGALNDTVKAVKVDGVEPTVANVENGSYTIVRPFNIVLNDGTKLSDAAQDFENYILSKEGQEIINVDYIQINGNADAFTSNGAEGKVVVAGSSSVTPVMEKLAESYQKVNSKVTVEVQQSDSSTGVKSAQDGSCDIGMASRDLKDDETGVKSVAIAKDAIAIVVNKDNSVDSLTLDQIKAVYTGSTTSWDDLK